MKYTEICEVRSFLFSHKALGLLTEHSSSANLTLKFVWFDRDSDLGSNLFSCHRFSPEDFKISMKPSSESQRISLWSFGVQIITVKSSHWKWNVMGTRYSSVLLRWNVYIYKGVNNVCDYWCFIDSGLKWVWKPQRIGGDSSLSLWAPRSGFLMLGDHDTC